MCAREPVSFLAPDPQWYKDAIIYQTHVRAFADSNGDGIGDFLGLIEKLDYIQDLGVTALWVLPFYPSPLRDDGYDIADYMEVNPIYGTLRDFRTLLKEAHRRSIRVITEVVMNHTSDQHAWFQRARRAKPGSRARDFYVWSDTPEKYQDARIIFKDFEPSNWSWDPVAKAYFWHRFYGHQPDLNFDNPDVREAMLRVVDFWLGMGVDGLRLDAVPYLYEREGTTGENLPETHAYLRALRRHVDERWPSRMLLAEANQWPEDSVAYFGDGDECHMAFHFPVMPRLFMALHMEDRYPVVEIMQRTPPIPETSQWAVFLRNHDELTLEMVTDEDRDYMYRVYAKDPQARINLGIRRRLSPLLGNHRRRIELMNGLLFSLPGSPVVYYGDEIGMGDNIYLGDRNSVRTPMQWSSDRNAGFSKANPQRLYLPVITDPEYHYEAVNAEAERSNPHSLYWWMKRLIALRKRYRAFSRGTIEFLRPENRRVLVFVRRHEDERILVVANLSRFVQAVELDLSEFRGMVAVEMFGRSDFPTVGESPYFLTLGPHSFYWFSLEARAAGEGPLDRVARGAEIPVVAVDSWERFPSAVVRTAVERVMPTYLRTNRWFGGKARRIRTVTFDEVIPLATGPWYVAVLRVDYTEGDVETYVLPLATASGERVEQVLAEQGQAVIARLQGGGRERLLYEAVWERGFNEALLEAIGHRRRLKGETGELAATPMRAFRTLTAERPAPPEPAILRVDQSNTSIRYGDRFILKLFRRIEDGQNPELEIARYLNEVNFPHVPPLAGWIEYRRPDREPVTLAILHGWVPNEGEAWGVTRDWLGRFFEAASAGPAGAPPPLPDRPLTELIDEEIPSQAAELIGPYLESARLLGQRTAELHLALAKATEDARFAPEPMTDFYRQSLYHGMLSMADETMRLLRQRLPQLPESVGADVSELLELEQGLRERFKPIRERKGAGLRLRCHGDYHLGQVLFTGQDFVIIDFEGEPARPVGERRIKRSPLRDVAGMLRSFHYAASAALLDQVPGLVVTPEETSTVESWAEFWYAWVSVAFLRAYVDTARPGGFLPGSQEELQGLLDAFLIEKAVYELRYEMNNRPDWLRIPARGIARLARSTR